MFEQRDILLIPVPFTDLSAAKQRPGLVLSGTAYNATSRDVVVAAITSNLSAVSPGVEIGASDLDTGWLPKPSRVRADKIYTLSQSIVRKKLGNLSQSIFAYVLLELDDVLARHIETKAEPSL